MMNLEKYLNQMNIDSLDQREQLEICGGDKLTRDLFRLAGYLYQSMINSQVESMENWFESDQYSNSTTR